MPASAATAESPAVEVCGVVKRYEKVEALRGIDLTVARGEMFALLGPNGAGKTTLFSILATLRAPTEGSARVLGRDVTVDRDGVRRDMGIVFQEPAIEQRLSGRDNLLLMGLFYGLSPSGARQRAAEILAELGLAEAADRPAKTLSGGQRRKLELARALVTDPKILFLDEATLGLDVDARRMFWAQVRSLASTGRTVFFTTHYMEEAEVADRIALIDGGRIVALDTPRALKARIGGGVIRLKTSDDAQARAWLAAHGHALEQKGEELMLVHPDPAAVLPEILRELPVRVQRVEVHEPSLEDVFLQLTGRGLAAEIAANGARPNGSRPGGAS
jgi:ABC-2 type transport system ATP-binding protein